MKAFEDSYGPRDPKARWRWLTGDGSWDDYGGTWYRRARDGAWWVIRFDNGHEHDPELPRYLCQLKRLDFGDIEASAIVDALKSCGLSRQCDGSLVNELGDEIESRHAMLAIVDACVSYGLGSPMIDDSSETHAVRLRGRVAKEAERLMKDSAALEDALDRPVNAIMTSARDYGSGRPLL